MTIMEEIYTLLKKYVQSINECNLELAREIWDTEGSVSLIHPNGYEYSFEEIKKHFYLEIMNNLFSKRDLKIKDIMTKFYGNTAFLEFNWDFYAADKSANQEIHTQGRETQFIVLRDSGWKISNIHYSTQKS